MLGLVLFRNLVMLITECSGNPTHVIGVTAFDRNTVTLTEAATVHDNANRATFDQIDEAVAAVGSGLSAAEVAMLRRYADEMYDQYCRFCTTCEGSCPQEVSVADVMRFAMYFKYYGREKDAMELYTDLPTRHGAAACTDCSGQCEGSCPFERRIRPELVEAHEMLSFRKT